MSYKKNLLLEFDVEDQLIKVDIDDILKHKYPKHNKNNTHINDVIENVDLNDIVIQFLDMKSALREHGFMDGMEMFDFMQIVKENFVEYETFEDKGNDDNNDELGYEMMPLEEKFMYEK